LATPSLIVTWAAFALYPHKGLADHKLVTEHFPWLNGLYLVDIITVVMPCMLSKSLEVQFPFRANEADQTYLHIVAGLGHLSADSFGLHLGCQHLVHVGLYVLPCSANMVTSPDRCRGTLDCGVVSIIVVLNYLGQTSRYLRELLAAMYCIIMPFICSIELLHLPIATWLIWEASNMFDMEVIKQFLHAGVSELATVVTLEYLGGMLFEERTEHLQDFLSFLLGYWQQPSILGEAVNDADRVPSAVVAPGPVAHINQFDL